MAVTPSTPLAPEALALRACRLARLDDYGADVLPDLRSLCSAFESSSALSAETRGRLTVHILYALITRLRLVACMKERPQIFEQPLNEPLIITGLARSGTTFLHELFCALPEARFLPFWEAREPIPDALDDDRRVRHAHYIAFMCEEAPELADKHPLDVDAAEECMYLLDPSLVSFSFLMDADSRACFDWIIAHDPREPYAIYRRLLQYVQATAPTKRLILKAPAHLGMLSALHEAVPEAKIIQTHRDPLEALPSLCSLLESLHRASGGVVDRTQLGLSNLAALRVQLGRNHEQRAKLAPGRLCDVKFPELTREPLRLLRDVYAHFNWEWTAEVEASLRARLARGLPKQVGRHRYTLSDYGLDERDLRTLFADYRERWQF